MTRHRRKNIFGTLVLDAISRRSGDLRYLNEDAVEGVRQTKPPVNYSRSGYGKKLGTSWEIHLGDGKWRRVYVMQWSNAGSAYILVGGETIFLGSFDPRWWLEKRSAR